LALSQSEDVGPMNRLLEVSAELPHVVALTRMQSAKQDIACVTNNRGDMVGIVTTARLREPLLPSRRPPGSNPILLA